MKFLKKKSEKDSKRQNSQEKSAEELRADPNLIQIYDDYGRERFISKETWRVDILPGTIKNNWDKPDDLYGIIVGALNDGFFIDVIEAAHHLYQIDPIPVRASCILGIVLLKNGKLDEAEKVLKLYINKFGEDGVIFTNIAKVQAERGLNEQAKKTLWHALELDPNQDNAVEWWTALHHEQSGNIGYIAALEKVAKLEGSWRAQLWLARASLENRDFEKARQYHNTILSKLEVIPPEVFMQISGDLGNAGRVSDIIEILGQRFDPEHHGLMAGNNIIKAYLELKDPIQARDILVKLYGLNRPDWKEHLKYWEERIDQTSDKFGTVDMESKISVTTLNLCWPIWSHKLSSSDSLLPIKNGNAPTVSFISSSCEYNSMSEKPVQQKTDKEGSLSRAIPLFLAEQVYMSTSAKAIMLTPVISGDGSFVLSGKPWVKETLIEMAESSNADFIFSGHLIARETRWKYQVILINVTKKSIINEFLFEISEKNPGPDVLALSQKIRKLLFRYCSLKNEKSPIKYRLPKDELLNSYLEGISQSLALSVATTDEAGVNILYGERSIFDHLLDLALSDTNSDITKLLFIGALAKNHAYGSHIFLEYQIKAEKLLHDYPLSDIADMVAKETMVLLYSTNIEEKK